MSTTNLRINKLEDGCNFKSICVKIPEEEESVEVKFGEWIEGETVIPVEKGAQKSSRLVVTIVSEEESTNVDLDACSKELEDKHDIYFNKEIAQAFTNTGSSTQVCKDNKSVVLEEYRADGVNNEVTLSLDTNTFEHKLQKVKESNVRIVENINMLNRTLTYVKKKEILDAICPKSMRTYPCNTCGKCFVYETGLRRHFSMRHAIAEMYPRWQVVWTCTQCFQVWPQRDQAFDHSVRCCQAIPDNQEYVREIKTSLLLQCEFCEKVFTSIPRLLTHSKMHTTISNYECTSCGLAFESYILAEKHWQICPWVNAYYNFELPKMLLCNACDRKFRNYDQLYNHRYKVGHYMTRNHSATDSAQPLVALVYQCELCAQQYNSIPQIISHRSQHHPHNDTSIYI